MKTAKAIAETLVLWLVITAGLASTVSIFVHIEPVRAVRST